MDAWLASCGRFRGNSPDKRHKSHARMHTHTHAPPQHPRNESRFVESIHGARFSGDTCGAEPPSTPRMDSIYIIDAAAANSGSAERRQRREGKLASSEHFTPERRRWKRNDTGPRVYLLLLFVVCFFVSFLPHMPRIVSHSGVS